jgi:mannosyltransferase
MAVSSRSTGQILHLAGYVDGVIAPYYLLVHLVTNGGIGSIRFLSALGVALTAGAVVELAHRIGLSRGASLCAAAVLLVVPVSSRYAQEARPYGLAMAAATISTLCLVCALREPARARRWWLGYVLATALLGYLHLLALLILAAHAATVLLLDRRRLPVLSGLSVAVMLVCAPLMVVARQGQHAVAWLPVPTLPQLLNLPYWFLGSAPLAPYILTAAGAGPVVAYMRRRLRATADPGHSAHGYRWALAVAGPWFVVPPGLLFAAGRMTPLYSERYLLICLPAGALLIGLGLSLLPRPAVGMVLLLIAVTAWPMQSALRQDTGHGENPRGLASAQATR